MGSRHLAYVGEPRTLQSLLLDPSHSLAAQSWSPRTQLHGVLNADGFGAGW
jgi:gamma-glutamyl hercynylcysteine S-oxide hydrolase